MQNKLGTSSPLLGIWQLSKSLSLVLFAFTQHPLMFHSTEANAGDDLDSDEDGNENDILVLNWCLLVNQGRLQRESGNVEPGLGRRMNDLIRVFSLCN